MYMKKLFFVTYCLFGMLSISLAWRPATRCEKRNRAKRSISQPEPKIANVPVADNIAEIAANQNKRLIEKYKDFKFVGVPVRAVKYDKIDYRYYEIDVPQNCTFITHPPSLLSSVYCQEDVACKLLHSVSTVKTYASADGFNWGTKTSSKLSLFEKIFEVGGEASYGQSYTCTFTEAGTTTDTLDCSIPAGSSKTLQLFNVQSDVKCWIGKVTMNREMRNGKYFVNVYEKSITLDEYLTLMKSKQIDFMPFEEDPFAMIVDTEKIPEYLLHKLKKLVPEYNPYTDLIVAGSYALSICFFGNPVMHDGYDKTIPFTNEHGNAVYQFACSTA